MGPLLLQDGDEDEVELVEEGTLGAAGIVVVGELDNKVDDKVTDAYVVSTAAKTIFFSDIP